MTDKLGAILANAQYKIHEHLEIIFKDTQGHCKWHDSTDHTTISWHCNHVSNLVLFFYIFKHNLTLTLDNLRMVLDTKVALQSTVDIIDCASFQITLIKTIYILRLILDGLQY